jgi:hypothetical protein
VGEIEGAGKLDVVVRLASSPSEEARFEGSLGVVEDLLDFRARETGRSPREWEMRSGLLMFTWMRVVNDCFGARGKQSPYTSSPAELPSKAVESLITGFDYVPHDHGESVASCAAMPGCRRCGCCPGGWSGRML